MEYLEDVDDKIIGLLSENGRATNTHIAKALNISEVLVANRIRTLVSGNIIQIVLQKSIHESSSTSVSALIEFYLSDPGKMEEVAAAVAGFDEVFSAYETARRPEIIVNCSAQSPRDLNLTIRRMADTVPHLVQMNALPILELGRFSTTLGALGLKPEAQEPAADTRQALIRLLQADGRQPVSALARQLGLSVTATRYRLENLLKEPGVKIGLVCDSASMGYRTWFDIRATITPRHLGAALERFSGHAAVRVVAHLAGQSNLALFLLTRSIEEVDRFVSEEIRPLPGLVDFTLMRVPRVFKYNFNYNL